MDGAGGGGGGVRPWPDFVSSFLIVWFQGAGESKQQCLPLGSLQVSPAGVRFYL